jgi:hypothetical protein
MPPMLLVGCGATRHDDPGAPSEAGSDRNLGAGGFTSQDAAAVVDSGVPACPDQLAFPPIWCEWDTLYGGSQTDTDAASPPCEIAASFEVPSPLLFRLYVDCTEVPVCGGTEQCWDVGDDGEVFSVRFSDALCSDLQENGYTRIDLVLECVQ